MADNPVYGSIIEHSEIESGIDSRWNGVKVDKNLTKADVVELDFSTSEPYLDENGDEVTDITITESNETIENPK